MDLLPRRHQRIHCHRHIITTFLFGSTFIMAGAAGGAVIGEPPEHRLAEFALGLLLCVQSLELGLERQEQSLCARANKKLICHGGTQEAAYGSSIFTVANAIPAWRLDACFSVALPISRGRNLLRIICTACHVHGEQSCDACASDQCRACARWRCIMQLYCVQTGPACLPASCTSHACQPCLLPQGHCHPPMLSFGCSGPCSPGTHLDAGYPVGLVRQGVHTLPMCQASACTWVMAKHRKTRPCFPLHGSYALH